MSLISHQHFKFGSMGLLEKGDKIDLVRNGELQLILTVDEVNENTVRATGKNGYVSRYRREFDGVIIRPADPMADVAYYHTGHPPEQFNSEAKQRYYEKVRDHGLV